MAEINAGETLRITHVNTGAHLHSHPLNYGHPHSSGQQQVTAFAGADYNDLWIVKPVGGNPIQNSDQIKLEHAATKRRLHSHPNIPAPVTTSQQEVTGWGGGEQTDPNDLWRVEIEGGGAWTTDKQVRLIHVATNAALHSHPGLSHPQWTTGQQEVTAYANRDANDFWQAAITEEVVPSIPTVISSPPNGHPFARGHSALLHVSDPGPWVRGKASLNTATGEFTMVLGLETNSTLEGVSGRIQVRILDSGGTEIAVIRMDQDMGISGKSPGKARIEEFTFSNPIPTGVAARATSLDVQIVSAARHIGIWGIPLQAVIDGIKIIIAATA